MKPVPAKAAAAKHVPAKSVPSKPVPAKMVHGHVTKPAVVAKPAVKHTVPSKKTAVKAPVKVQKKSEPAKKIPPGEEARLPAKKSIDQSRR